MDSIELKVTQNPHLKTYKYFMVPQICLRILATATSLAATWIMLTANQSVMLVGINFDARYTYSPAFKFFAIANIIACAFSVLSLFLVFILGLKASQPTNYFYMFLHDLVVMTLLMGGCAAASAIGYVGQYGNSHAGWMAICGHFGQFCNRVTVSVMLSYFSFFFYLSLTIISAHIQHSSFTTTNM